MKEYEKNIEYNPLSQELKLLFGLAIDNVDRIHDSVNWEYFYELVKKSRIQPLLASRLNDIAESDNYEVLVKIKDSEIGYIFNSMKQIAALEKIASAFDDAGIRVLSVKGPLTALKLYHNIGLRYSKDLDIWVDPAKVEESCVILEQHGWKLDPEYTNINTPIRRRTWMKIEQHYGYTLDGVNVELHWLMYPWKKEDFDSLWDLHEEQIISGQKVATLDYYNDVAFQIYHGARHIFWRLRWLIDAYYILKDPNLDIGMLYRKMVSEGTDVVLLETILLLNRTKVLQLPDICTYDFSISCKEDRIDIQIKDHMKEKFDWAMRLVKTAEDAMIATELRQELKKSYDLIWPWDGKIDTFSDRVFKAIAPRLAEWDKWDYPDSLYFLYYIRRPMYWIQRRLFRKTDDCI